jgi:hypothetical protein
MVIDNNKIPGNEQEFIIPVIFLGAKILLP